MCTNDMHNLDDTCDLEKSREFYGAWAPPGEVDFIWFYEISGEPPRGKATLPITLWTLTPWLKISFDMKFTSRGMESDPSPPPVAYVTLYYNRHVIGNYTSVEVGNTTYYQQFQNIVKVIPGKHKSDLCFKYYSTGDPYLNSTIILNVFLGNVMVQPMEARWTRSPFAPSATNHSKGR